MGRAMLIICAGVLVSLGIVSLSTSQRGTILTKKAATYANMTRALNAAHTAIQIGMQNINEDDTWATTHDSAHAWTTTIDGATVLLYVDYIYKATNYWDADSIRLVANSKIATEDGSDKYYRGTVSSVYLKAPFSNLVPPFQSAITIASNQVNPFSASGSASISGNAPAGSGCEDKPAMTIAKPDGSGPDSTSYANELNNIDTQGSPKVKVNNDLSYEPTDELIDRLENSPDRVNVTGNYGDSLGTAENPGIFFIGDKANLTGNQKAGYGIMVVQSDGGMTYNGELDVAGNFEWNGLIIFENAFDFDGRGTPTINGSVLIGNTSEFTGDIDVSINGNIKLQYDCRAEEYAKMAAADAVKQHKYTRVVSMERTRLE